MILPQSPSSSTQNSSNPLKLKKGTKMAQTRSPPPSPLPPIQSINSSFQMTEYLSLLIKRDPADVQALVDLPFVEATGGLDTSPGKKTSGKKEIDLWIYEHLRRLPQDLNPLITSLLPQCTRSSCPEMKAGDWQYLCVAHANPASGQGEGDGCCAIDYILHTVDQHTALWNSAQAFPSRLAIKAGSERYFGQQVRRISRVFGHAWFHHREVFEECEAENNLYARFLALVARYGLMEKDLLVIPASAIPHVSLGGDDDEEEDEEDGEKDPVAGPSEPRAGAGMGVKEGGERDVNTRSEEHEDEDDDDNEDYRWQRGPETAVKRSNTARRYLTKNRRGQEKESTRGKKKLFQVDIPKEEEDDEVPDWGHGTFEVDLNGNDLKKKEERLSMGLEDGRQLANLDEDEDEDDPDSDPETAVKAASVDSDEEDEKMVEDVREEGKGKSEAKETKMEGGSR